MKKILKTQGTLNQWIDLVALSLEQMGLQTEINNCTILALHNGLEVMKFELSENDGVVLAIDYFDDRDLNDFKKFAAQIISDPDSYRNSSKIQQNSNSSLTSNKNINDYVHPDSVPENKPSNKKGLKIALIIVGVVVLLAAIGFGGYKFYQSRMIPKDMLAEAMIAYNNEDYETAVNIAASIISQYPNSAQASDAQTLKSNAEAELERLKLQSQTNEKSAAAQTHMMINSLTLSGPDGDGNASALIDYTNTSAADLANVTFGITFTDANGAPVVVEGADSETILCTDETALAAGQSRGEGNLLFGPYNNSSISGFTIVSVTANYSDGFVLSLTTPEEVAWILPQQQ